RRFPDCIEAIDGCLGARVRGFCEDESEIESEIALERIDETTEMLAHHRSSHRVAVKDDEFHDQLVVRSTKRMIASDTVPGTSSVGKCERASSFSTWNHGCDSA